MIERPAIFLGNVCSCYLDDQLKYHMSLGSFLVLSHQSLGLSLDHLDLRITFANGESRRAALSNEYEYDRWLDVADQFPCADVSIDTATGLIACTIDFSRACAPAYFAVIAPHMLAKEREFARFWATADSIGVPALSAIPHSPRASARMRAFFDREMGYAPLALPSPHTLRGPSS